MESTFTHKQLPAAREALAALHGLRECVITHLNWSETPLSLVVRLMYIWTDSGDVCFSVGLEPREIILRFGVINKFCMLNALTPAMIKEPGRIDWGISEIAELILRQSADSFDFAEAEFAWESSRRILIWFRTISFQLLDHNH